MQDSVMTPRYSRQLRPALANRHNRLYGESARTQLLLYDVGAGVRGVWHTAPLWVRVRFIACCRVLNGLDCDRAGLFWEERDSVWQSYAAVATDWWSELCKTA